MIEINTIKEDYNKRIDTIREDYTNKVGVLTERIDRLAQVLKALVQGAKDRQKPLVVILPPTIRRKEGKKPKFPLLEPFDGNINQL